MTQPRPALPRGGAQAVRGSEYPTTRGDKHTMETTEMTLGGAVTAAHDRVIITRSSGHPTTVAVPEGHCVRVRFWPEDSQMSAYMKITNDQARGWTWAMSGEGVRLSAVSSGHASISIDYATPRADSAIRVSVEEVTEANFAIREAREAITRCADLLSTWKDGGSPVRVLISDLRQSAYIA